MSLTISKIIPKLEGPRMFATTSTACIFVQMLMYIWTDSIHVTLQQRERVFFLVFILRVSSAPAHCGSSSYRSGKQGSEGGSLD